MIKKRMIAFLCLLILISVFAYYSRHEFSAENGVIESVIDGDTLNAVINNRTEKVRLLGINTPEKGELAYEEAKEALSAYVGMKITLEHREEEKTDKYGRMLAYAYADKKLINEELAEKGLAHSFYYSADKNTRKIEKAEKKAREKELGIWKKSSGKCAGCIKLEELNNIDPGEYIILKNNCNFECSLIGWSIKDETSHVLELDFSIASREEKKLSFEGRVWNDDKDAFFLRDEKGELVIFYRYGKL